MSATENAPESIAATYRGRLAPSPTGLLHLGHARTFWIAAERARDARGRLVLRSEDLDPQRSKPEYAQAILEDLQWIGLRWDEGPDVGGACAPYEQSARWAGYLAAWRLLVERGHLYPCRCSRRELRESAGAPHEAADAPAEDDQPVSPELYPDVYPGTCRPPPGALRVPHAPGGVNWRFRVPDGEEVRFADGALGWRRYVAGRHFGDFLVWRRDDVPAYQLAVCVDDAAMEITEVVRGADLLRSTARQLLLYRALGLRPPAWYHCPLVTDGAGQRLAKRADALSLRALRARGLSPADVRAMAGLLP